MGRIWTSFVSLLLHIPISYGAATSVEILTDESYPPYTYSKNGIAVGIYPEIIHAIDQKLQDYDITIRPVPWKRGLKLIESGRSFALMPPYFHPESRSFISPYSAPIINEEVVVYCDKTLLDNHPRNYWPNDFYGLTIGINSGFNIGGSDFQQAAENGQLFISEAKSNRINILKLRSRRIDCYVNDRISILWEVKQLLEDGSLEKPLNFQFATHINTESGYIAYTNVNEQDYPYKEDFVRAFDSALSELSNTGVITKIINDYTRE